MAGNPPLGRDASGLKARELVEAAAFASAFRACPPEVARSLGCETAEVGGATCVAMTALPTLTMTNRATGLGLRGPATREGLEEVAAWFAGRGVRHAVALSPDAEPPAELPRWLAERGYEPGYAWAKFERGTDRAPDVETELDVRPVEGGEAAAFADVVARGYGMPPELAPWLASVPLADGFSCYLAWAGDEPAGAGAVFVEGDHGWLGFAATLPEQRRRGAQGAITAARIRRAAELGARTLVTETGELVPDRPSSSYRNIVRYGFREAYVRPNFELGA